MEIDVNKNSNLEHKNLKYYVKNLGKNAIKFIIVLMIANKKISHYSMLFFDFNFCCNINNKNNIIFLFNKQTISFSC